MQDELEERERSFKKARQEQASEKKKREAQNNEIIEEGKRMREEREKRLEEEWRRDHAPAKEPVTLQDEDEKHPLDSTIKLKYPLALYPTLTTADALASHLTQHRFGPLDEPIVVSVKAAKKTPGKPPKFATALVPFVTVGDAFALVCAAGLEKRGLKDIEVSWASGQEPAMVKKMKEATSTASKTPASAPKSFTSFVCYLRLS
jgi:DnaJ homolog subfamily C member 17